MSKETTPKPPDNPWEYLEWEQEQKLKPEERGKAKATVERGNVSLPEYNLTAQEQEGLAYAVGLENAARRGRDPKSVDLTPAQYLAVRVRGMLADYRGEKRRIERQKALEESEAKSS
jgi:hypothetical protein